jgi:6-phosphogluconolactonase
VQHQVEVLADGDAVARAAATVIAERANAAVAAGGSFTMAVSGGRTPWLAFEHLLELDVPWDRTVLFQVDERCAPPDDPDRNLSHLLAALGDVPVDVRPLPVESGDLDAAAAGYAASLPEWFDLVHLGLGADGHTASLVPGDPVLDVVDRLVAVTGGTYQGRRRMTLTYPALARARRLLWLVEGDAKRAALAALLDGDRSVPAGRVQADASLVLCDRAAAADLAG